MTATPLILRDAISTDAAAIGAIWNPVIRDTNFTFWPDPRSDAEIAGIIATRNADGHGFFVAEAGGNVAGFAAYGQFRGGDGYARALEHTVYTAPAMRGRGVGSRLLAHLEDHARDRGGRVMIGVVTAGNIASVRFHLGHGYRQWGHLPAVGWKFGRFHDALIMGKDLAVLAPSCEN